ncbi:MAG: flagellar hook-basal body complex protein FliE [Planctomycetes bacterium]|nr:flagellar hook-basal body complex protein FliE [Planctomycetota bacterium]
MPHEVNSILSRPIQPFGERPQTDTLQQTGKTSFRDILTESIKKVDNLQKEADTQMEALVTGETENIAEVMAAVEKADLAFRHLMEIRNKLVSAYEEINRIRI